MYNKVFTTATTFPHPPLRSLVPTKNPCWNTPLMETLSPPFAREREPLAPPTEGTIIAYPTEKLKALILDMDGTLYRNEDYIAHTHAVDLHIIAEHLRLPPDQAQTVIEEARRALGATLGTPRARLTQTLTQCFRMNIHEWNTKRAEGYQPERYLEPNPHLPEMLSRLLERFSAVCIASNSPSASVGRILRSLAVPETLLSRIPVFAPDTLACHKPDPSFFRAIAAAIGLPPTECMSVGNEADNDAFPAMRCGMGAAIVENPSQILRTLDPLTNTNFLVPLSLEEIRKRFARRGGPYILGIVGRAGAGKSTFARTLLQEHIDHSPHVRPHLIHLDAFFRLSSQERSAWLNASDISREERQRREDQRAWWDFASAAQVLQHLRSGMPVHLENVYNQSDDGRKTGKLHIDPHQTGGNLYIVEGVGTPLLSPLLDGIIYVYAHETVRHSRVYERDKVKRGAEEAEKRWGITQRFENALYHAGGNPLLRGLPTAVVDNSLTAGNSPNWRTLPPHIPER